MSFSDDTGTADPELLAALRDFAAGGDPAERSRVLQALRGKRLLIPVVSPGAGEMQGVVFTSVDGRKGLPAFTSVESMALWDAAARPIPESSAYLARHCMKEGLDALLIDMASAHRFAVQGIELAVVAAEGEPQE